MLNLYYVTDSLGRPSYWVATDEASAIRLAGAAPYQPPFQAVDRTLEVLRTFPEVHLRQIRLLLGGVVEGALLYNEDQAQWLVAPYPGTPVERPRA